MKDPAGIGMPEPDIVINGKTLTFGQAMTMRVAVSSFHMYVSDAQNAKVLGTIAEGYAARCAEIETIMRGGEGS